MRAARMILVGFLALVCLTPHAEARRRSKLALLELELDGLPAELGPTLDKALRAEAGASSKMRLLPKPALDFKQMQLATGCSGVSACLKTLGSTIKAQKVVRAVLKGSVDRATLELVMVDVRSGKVTQSVEAELTAVSEESTAELRIHVAALFGVKKKAPAGRIELYVASDVGTLEGAELVLDDQQVERKGLEEIAPGEHRIEVRQTGFETFVWQGQVRPARASKVGVMFQPVQITPPVATLPTGEDPEPEEDPVVIAESEVESDDGGVRVFTWILGGSAVAAGVLGTVFGIQKIGLENDIRDAQSARNDSCAMGNLADCNASVCDDTLSDDCSNADTAATVATVSWVLFGTLAAGSVAAFFLESEDRDESAFSGAIIPVDGGAHGSMTLRF